MASFREYKKIMDDIAGRYNKPIKQEPYEFELFAKEIDHLKPRVIMEIGVLRGGIISYYRDKVEKVIGIDRKQRGYPEDVIIGDSRDNETMNKVAEVLNGDKVDVLYIDGDGTYDGCKSDFEAYSGFVKDGGIIAFHDIIPDRVDSDGKGIYVERYKVWEEMKNKYNYKEIIDPENRWGGVGIIYK